jgi:hypothetical protein
MSASIRLVTIAFIGVVAGAGIASAETKQHAAKTAANSGAVVYQNQAIHGGKVMGADPDPNIRGQLLRQYKQ